SSGFSLGRLTVVVRGGHSQTIAIGLLYRQERRLKPELQHGMNSNLDPPAKAVPDTAAPFVCRAADLPDANDRGKKAHRGELVAPGVIVARCGSDVDSQRAKTSFRTDHVGGLRDQPDAASAGSFEERLAKQRVFVGIRRFLFQHEV